MSGTLFADQDGTMMLQQNKDTLPKIQEMSRWSPLSSDSS